MAVTKVAGNSKRGAAPGERRGGRQKGTPNKLTRSAKQAFEHAFEDLGGADALAAWARKNPSDFYRLYARLMPKPVEVSGPEGAPVPISTIPTFNTAQEFAAWVRSEQSRKRPADAR